MLKKVAASFLVLATAFLFGGCSKEPVKLVSAQMVDSLDRGSGNFDRVLQLCFDKPLTSEYYHKITLITKEEVKVSGDGLIKPLASDPDNKCHLRNLYLYINKDSPVDARQLIKDYVRKGNVRQLLVQVYYEKPEGKELPVTEKVFNDL